MKLRTHLLSAAVGSAVVALAAAGILSMGAADAGNAAAKRSSVKSVAVHGSDRLPSLSAEDWVTYADHVVIASAVSQKEISPTQEEITRGEGSIGRTVTMKVEKTLWSSADAAQPAPITWQYGAAGWQFFDGSTTNRARLVMHDRPRVEVGHTYVMALTWEPARCSSGDPQEPARWMGLGEGSEIPYDAGVLGQGELEGRTQSVQQARAAADEDPDGGLEEELAGQDASALAAALRAAHPAATTTITEVNRAPCS